MPHFYITKPQRQALRRLWVRYTLDHDVNSGQRVPYRQFRKYVQPCFDKSGCIMVHVWNIWIGIERDGYTHS